MRFNEMVYAAGIILYHPNIEDLNRIYGYLNSFDTVLLYKNSEVEIPDDIINNTKIIILGTGNNDGICIAINEMIKVAVKKGFSFLCTLDQDSQFSNEDINKIQKYIGEHSMANVALISPLIFYLGRENRKNQNSVISEVEWVITSGTFINLKLISSYNIEYDINYFIDRCDKDFCIQCTNNGFKILRLNCSVLYQKLGDIKDNKAVGHNAIRHYYIFRNRLYYNKKYFTFWKRVFLNLFQSIKQINIILFHENDKIKKIKYCLYAGYDYLNGNMGKSRIK